MILIAPNDFRQYHMVSRRFEAVEMDGFVQACMAQLAGGLVLARLYHLAYRTIARALPLNCAPPPGFRLVFS